MNIIFFILVFLFPLISLGLYTSSNLSHIKIFSHWATPHWVALFFLFFFIIKLFGNLCFYLLSPLLHFSAPNPL